MEKLKYIILFFAALGIVACNTENDDFKIEYTAIHPMGGQYRITITDEAGTAVALPGSIYCFVSNTMTNSETECWLRIGSFSTPAKESYSINGKIGCNLNDLTFSGSNVVNLAGNVVSSDEKFTVSNGKIELNGAKAPSGTVADKISFSYTRANFPGKTYSVTGYRYTGWTED